MQAPQILNELKTWCEYFNLVLEGKKQFELRRNDRDFRVGSYLLLREWHPTGKEYTGRALLVRIVMILSGVPNWGLKEGYCIMGIERVADVVKAEGD